MKKSKDKSDEATGGRPPDLTAEQAAIVVLAPQLTLTEAAWYLRVSRRWLMREGIPKHKIPHLRPPSSNKIAFRRVDLDRVLESWLVDHGVGTPPKDKKKKGKK